MERRSTEERFPIRAIVEQLSHPYWYAEHGYADTSRRFWDKQTWERGFANIIDLGYNTIIYMCEPWLEHQWQTFLIRHDAFPEARELEPEQSARIIDQVSWIFHRARE